MSVQTLNKTQVNNNQRTVSGNITVRLDDVEFYCDTTLVPTNIYLLQIPSGQWSTQYVLYIKDQLNNASVNNITLIAPTGFLINGNPTYVINTNFEAVKVTITSNTDYLVSPGSNGGALNSLIVDNTVFVMKNGNDTTGIVQRFDKPFLTFTAARAALKAFFTGPTAPASTNRIQVIGYSGYYLESLIMDPYVDYYLNDCVIEAQAGSNATIDDNNIAVDSVVYGQATIKRSGTGSNLNSVLTRNSGSTMTVYAKYITSSVGDSISISAGTQYIFSTVDSTYAGGNSLYCNGGNQFFVGPVNSGMTCNAGYQNITGNITDPGTNAVVSTNAGTLSIQGDIITNGTAVFSVVLSGGNTYVYGNVSQPSGGAYGVLSAGGLYEQTGDINNGSSSYGVAMQGGAVILKGNINQTGSGTALYLAANSSTSIATIYGNVNQTNAGSHEAVLTTSSSGGANIYGNVTRTGGNASFSAVNIGRTSTLNITGNISDTASTTAVVTFNNTGTLNITGNITTAVAGTAGINDTAGGTVNYFSGIVTADTNAVSISASGGTHRYYNVRLVVTGSNKTVINLSAATAVILQGTTLVGTGSGNSVAGGTENILVYGAVSNKAAAAGITQQVSSILVDPNVQ